MSKRALAFSTTGRKSRRTADDLSAARSWPAARQSALAVGESIQPLTGTAGAGATEPDETMSKFSRLQLPWTTENG